MCVCMLGVEKGQVFSTCLKSVCLPWLWLLWLKDFCQVVLCWGLNLSTSRREAEWSQRVFDTHVIPVACAGGWAARSSRLPVFCSIKVPFPLHKHPISSSSENLVQWWNFLWVGKSKETFSPTKPQWMDHPKYATKEINLQVLQEESREAGQI